MLAWLKRDAAVTALVPMASIYPGTVPATRTFPFIRMFVVVATPFVASGLDSYKIRASFHAFALPLYDDAGEMIAPAEQRASFMAGAMATSLDGAVLPLGDGWKARPTWLRSRLARDPHEADAWQGIVDMRAEVSG